VVGIYPVSNHRIDSVMKADVVVKLAY
jgi:hypothetical protein